MVCRFAGRCLYRDGFGLGCKFLLRNILDGEGVEIVYHLFSPLLQKIEVGYNFGPRSIDHIILHANRPVGRAVTCLSLER